MSSCSTCGIIDTDVIFPVSEEASLYLERLLNEYTSLFEMILSVSNDRSITNSERFIQTINEYKEAFEEWDVCYTTLMEMFLPQEYWHSSRFSFDDKSFICEGETDMKLLSLSETNPITPDERDNLRNAWYDFASMDKLVKGGCVAPEIIAEYKRTDRAYQEIWTAILTKYFPDVDISQNGTSEWTCDFIACTVTVSPMSQASLRG